MLTLGNGRMRLSVREDGSEVLLEDGQRRCAWRLDERFRTYRTGGRGSPPVRLPLGRAERQGDGIAVSHAIGNRALRYLWALRKDHVEVSLQCDAPEVNRVALPGPFVPVEGGGEIAVPVYQGVLIGGTGSNWQASVGHGGHAQFSMAMAAAIGSRGALLVTHDSPANWLGTYGEQPEGPFVFFEQLCCPVGGWQGATVRLWSCDADVTSACKHYRAVVAARGDLVLWPEKLAAKPILGSLFGAVMAFTGYNAGAAVDYVASARKLKAYGFRSVFLYPVRMCHYTLEFLMGGDRPVWLSDADLEALHAIGGVYAAPWAWVIEGLDDGSEEMARVWRLGPDGGRVAGWRMDERQWHHVCTPYQAVFMRRRLATDMRSMDWLHFDVNASVPGRPCCSAEHELHGCRSISAREDMQCVRELLSPRTVGNRAVSSEGFNDYYAAVYDIGTTKMLPGAGTGARCVPVPMTMLVFHDSCVHDWWELQNYNELAAWPLGEVEHGLGRCGSGAPRLKAAVDALYGCPPNVFPFGRQYAWADRPGRRTVSFTVRLEDAPVQEAIRAALPVAALHARTGMCEMTEFEFLSEDRLVQATAFSDGTRVVANLSDSPREVEGHGVLAPHEWREGT